MPDGRDRPVPNTQRQSGLREEPFRYATGLSAYNPRSATANSPDRNTQSQGPFPGRRHDALQPINESFTIKVPGGGGGGGFYNAGKWQFLVTPFVGGAWWGFLTLSSPEFD